MVFCFVKYKYRNNWHFPCHDAGKVLIVAGVGMELNTIFHLYDKSKLSKNLQNYSGLLAGYLHLTPLEGGENAALGHRGKAGEGGLGLQFAKRHL
jgi:hypothetical protein